MPCGLVWRCMNPLLLLQQCVAAAVECAVTGGVCVKRNLSVLQQLFALCRGGVWLCTMATEGVTVPLMGTCTQGAGQHWPWRFHLTLHSIPCPLQAGKVPVCI